MSINDSKMLVHFPLHSIFRSISRDDTRIQHPENSASLVPAFEAWLLAHKHSEMNYRRYHDDGRLDMYEVPSGTSQFYYLADITRSS